MNFVTSTQVIQNAFSNMNTDPSLIKDVAIQQTQLKHIKPVLTEDLYELIETENNATNLSTANQTLFDDYIVPAMYYLVKYDSIYNVAVKSNSKGLNRGTGNFSTPADNTDLGNSMTVALDNGMQILKRMSKYIEDNISDYPTYDITENVLNKVSHLGGIIY